MSTECRRNFSKVALSLTDAGLTLTYWFVHCDQAAVWTTCNDIDVRCRGRKDTSILGGDVMTIRKPVVSQAAWVFASIASTSALGQTAPEPSADGRRGSRGNRRHRLAHRALGLFLDQSHRDVRRGSHRAERHGQYRTGDESVAAVRAGPDVEHGRRRGACGTRVAQPAWSRRNTQSRAARRPAPAAVERECGRRRQPDSAVHPLRRRDDHRRRVRGVRLRRDVRRRQLQEHRPTSKACSSMCVRA